MRNVWAPLFAVRLHENTDTSVQDQITDIGMPFDECIRRARNYLLTSHYQKSEVIELEVAAVTPVDRPDDYLPPK